jgi:formyl-CoA transferase
MVNIHAWEIGDFIVTTQRQGPLSDIRVIELGQLIAGPFCGQLLADMGADVIKVEPPGQGDPMREWGRGEKPVWWAIAARNKRCITLNLRGQDGQRILKQMLQDADILIENFRPGTLEKWELAPDTLHALNPRLIITRVSGFGQTGPYHKRAGYASVGEAMGGFRYVNGYPDRPTTRAGISIGDSLAATFACNATLAALHHAARTGEGQVIDATIYESVLSVMEATVAEYAVNGVTRERSGSYLPGIAPSNAYPCSDGEIVIGANQDNLFARLAKAVGRPEWAKDERYATHRARGDHQEQLDGLIADWTRTRTLAEVDKVMESAGIPCGPIYRAADMLDDPHFQARETIIDVEHADLPNLKMQNVFPRMSKTQGEVRWPGPAELGAHNEEVFAEFGLTPEELVHLRAKGVV